MRNLQQLRQRFLADNTSVRLGGAAANLARVESFSDHPGHGEVVRGIVEETAHMIEWMAPAADLELQVVLVDCQRCLARWRLAWPHLWSEPERRLALAREAGAWSRRLLAMSGLLPAAGQAADASR